MKVKSQEAEDAMKNVLERENIVRYIETYVPLSVYGIGTGGGNGDPPRSINVDHTSVRGHYRND